MAATITMKKRGAELPRARLSDSIEEPSQGESIISLLNYPRDYAVPRSM
jgi:hypothetical protein